MYTNNCKEEISSKLSALPSKWKGQIVDFVCMFINQQGNDLTCEDIEACIRDGHTSELSEFEVNGSEVCITFKDNNGVSIERCFNFGEIINRSLDDVDPGCIASPVEWVNMEYVEKWQAIIDKVCDTCIDAPPTTSSTTTTTLPPTTTTTTMPTVDYSCPYGDCCVYTVTNETTEDHDVVFINNDGEEETRTVSIGDTETFSASDIISIPIVFKVGIAACTTTSTTTYSTLPPDCSIILSIVGSVGEDPTTTTTSTEPLATTTTTTEELLTTTTTTEPVIITTETTSPA